MAEPSLELLTAAEPTAVELEDGRLLFAGPCDFLWAAVEVGDLPEPNLPEVAFAGRSNVGKSSLLNALTGRNALARVSNTPGRTRQLNFFDLGGRLRLVDMPGYGHAEAPKSEIARWGRLIDDYLRGRVTLSRLSLLIDARHGFKPGDVAAMDRLDKAAVVYQIVLTKIDKLSAGELRAMLAQTADAIRRRPAAFPTIFPTSAETGAGVPNLRAALAALAEPRQNLA